MMKMMVGVAALSAAMLAVPAKAAPMPFPAQVQPMAAEHAGHKHDEHKGEKRELGTKNLAGYKVKVVQETEVKAGEEAAFAIFLSEGKAKPKAVRAWIGSKTAEGSVKSKAVAEEDEWHAHVEVPKPIPAKSQFWVEIETASGKQRIGFDYK